MIGYAALNTFFVILISPFFMGVIKKAKALCQRRKGQPVLQQYYNLLKLFKKETVVSHNSSWIMLKAPYINIAVIIVASLFVPVLFSYNNTFSFYADHTTDNNTSNYTNPNNASNSPIFGNILLFLYLLALGKFFMALSGLDAGSAFGGMGSSREMSLSAILEPITFLILLAFAFVFKTTNFFEIFTLTSTTGIVLANPALILLAASLFVVLIAETARVPVDNPETHLELTMIHEAMILEQSGKNLALMEASHAIKQTLFMAVFINIFVPFGYIGNTGNIGNSAAITFVSIMIAMLWFSLKGTILAVAIALFESSTAKLRLFKVPELFMISFFLAFLTIIIEVFR
ncbi:NADH-quinone oxidoreductase subunit H [Candidatus Woesearchaeota archaeon]|nr:NADH-quinone oxidoreductase subunit H [Candidatus Woesearchaeota archaeon]